MNLIVYQNLIQHLEVLLQDHLNNLEILQTKLKLTLRRTEIEMQMQLRSTHTLNLAELEN